MPRERRVTDLRIDQAGINQCIQEKTFRNWCNAQLERGNKPPVTSLLEDIKDGSSLRNLFEVLTGEEIKPNPNITGRPVHIDNIKVVLERLQEKGVLLVGINASSIADGNPSIVLGLIWKIILHFEIDDRVSLPTTPKSRATFATPSVIAVESEKASLKQLESWVEEILRKQGLQFRGFGEGWQDGLAFLALIQHVQPGLVDMEQARALSRRDRLEQAFTLAQDRLGVPRLLDPADVDMKKPDKRSIVTYVAQFRNRLPVRRQRRPRRQRQEDQVDAAGVAAERSGALPATGSFTTLLAEIAFLAALVYMWVGVAL